MDTKTFHADPAKLSQLSDMLAGHGVVINPNEPSGETKQGGWDISWASANAGYIAITVNKHPFAEEGFLWSNLSKILGNPVA